MKRRRRTQERVPCPHCGEYIATSSTFCRHCGSDRQTGWAGEEEIAYQSVELPEDEESLEKHSRQVRADRWTRTGAILGLVAMAILTGVAVLVITALARGC